MPTIAAIALGDARFNILVNALTYVDTALPGTDLVGTLSSSAVDLTVFAPTDAAFARLAADLCYAGPPTDEAAVTGFLVGALSPETIRDVILYHVSAGSQTLAQISAHPVVQTLNGATLTADGPTLIDQEPDLPDPSLVQTDVAASNGIVHVIDRVLLPFDVPGNDAPTITGIVAASGATDNNCADFDILLQAVQAAGLASALNDPAADLTVVAPTDGAFLDLAVRFGFQGTSEADGFAYLVDVLTLLSGGGNPVPLLTDILLYHVAGGSLQLSQVAAAGSVTTLPGPTLGVSGTRLVDVDTCAPNPGLVATDIQAANGIVHVIDGVLLPVALPGAGSPNDIIVGTGRADRIIAGNGVNLVDGNADNDAINAGTGNDTLRGDAGRDTVNGGNGGNGNDSIDGGGSKDALLGGKGNDILSGDAGNDSISGGSGKDLISGGHGDDVLSGGAGDDTFVFRPNSGSDTVRDFDFGHDVLDLRAFAIGSFADLVHLVTIDRHDTVITLGEGTEIRLANFDSRPLDAGDVLLA